MCVLPFSQADRVAKNCLDYDHLHLCERSFTAMICIRGQFPAQAPADSANHRGFVAMLHIAKSSDWIFLKHSA